MYIDRFLLVFIFGAFLLSPAFLEWWSDGGIVWYRPFAVWLVLIGLSFWIGRNRDKTNDPYDI
jgi:hypothetical protein